MDINAMLTNAGFKRFSDNGHISWRKALANDAEVILTDEDGSGELVDGETIVIGLYLSPEHGDPDAEAREIAVDAALRAAQRMAKLA